jgi:hypothetical protein
MTRFADRGVGGATVFEKALVEGCGLSPHPYPKRPMSVNEPTSSNSPNFRVFSPWDFLGNERRGGKLTLGKNRVQNLSLARASAAA